MALTSDNKSSRLFKELMGVSETTMTRDFFEEPIRTRAAVLPSQVWLHGNRIPDGSSATDMAAIRELGADETFDFQFDELDTRPIVARRIDHAFTPIDAGTNNSFKLVRADGSQVTTIIPFNFGDGTSYNYSLKKKDGTPIAFGMGEWVLDSNSGVITFYKSLTGVDAKNPPVISYFEYVADVGLPESVTGFEGVIVPVKGVRASNLVSSSTSNLDSAITVAVNTVHEDFEAIFGWDGADDKEGIAVSFEKLIPLLHANTQDVVKCGIGMDANSEVKTLITRKSIDPNTTFTNLAGLAVDFVSQSIPTGVISVRYNPDDDAVSAALEGGEHLTPVTGISTLEPGQAIKVKCSMGFFSIRRTNEALPIAVTEEDLTVIDTTTVVGFFTWNSTTQEYTPWTNRDPSAEYDLGIPVVLKLGRIPASIKLSQTGGGGFADVITPEYYGVRPQTIVVAVTSGNDIDDTEHPEGVDYLVRNKTGEYLNDIFAKIFDDHDNTFGGTIYLRAGNYKVDGPIEFSSRKFNVVGETTENTVIKAAQPLEPVEFVVKGITRAADTSVHIKNVTIEVLPSSDSKISVISENEAEVKLLMSDVTAPNVDLFIEEKCGYLIDRSALRNVTINGTIEEFGNRDLTSSTVNEITQTGNNCLFRNVTANKYKGPQHKSEAFISTIFNANTFNVGFVGLGGYINADQPGMQPSLTVPVSVDKENYSMVLDLAMRDGTFRSGGTFGSITVNGEKVATTANRFSFDGDKAVSLLIDDFFANNDTDNNQYGFQLERVEGSDTQVRLVADGGPIGASSFLNGCYFKEIESIAIDTLYSDNTVSIFGDDIDERFKMSSGKFEIIDGNGQRRWTSFAAPFLYNDDIYSTENPCGVPVGKKIELLYDTRTLKIKDGKLEVLADAPVITLDPTELHRPYDAYTVADGDTQAKGPDVTATTVYDALKDLYATKADLIGGRVPLQQMPEEVVSGGLTFKGLWNFVDKDGDTKRFPTEADLAGYDQDGVAEVSKLQIGWFVVIANNPSDEHNPAAPQEAEDGVIYTAGDWAIYRGLNELGGARWEKLDNSVSDAVYSILPTQTPDGNLWDEAQGGDGLLALGKTTVVESLDQINEILRKLAPPKPKPLSDLGIAPDTNTNSRKYTAARTEDGSVQNYVWTEDDVLTFVTPQAVAGEDPDTIDNLFFDGDSSIIEYKVNGVSDGRMTMSVANDAGRVDGDLKITHDIDPHFGVSGQENFWKGLRAELKANEEGDKLPLDKSTLYLSSMPSENPALLTETDFDVYIDNPTPTEFVVEDNIPQGMAVMFYDELENFTEIAENPSVEYISEKPELTKHLSGVPSVAVGASFTVNKVAAFNTVGTFYNNDRIVKFECLSKENKNLDTVERKANPADNNLVLPEGFEAPFGGLVIAPTEITLTEGKTLTEQVRLRASCFNSKDQQSDHRPTMVLSNVRYDTAIENASRVMSGSGVNPTIFGDAWNDKKQLNEGLWNCELQNLNGTYTWPKGDYSSFTDSDDVVGPNYELVDTGDTLSDEDYRWVTYKAGKLSVENAFTLNILGGKGLEVDANNRTKGIKIFAKVVNTTTPAAGTGWINGNDPYAGTGDTNTEGSSAMVAGESDKDTKRVTFGTFVASGDLYVRIGIAKSKKDSITFTGMSITN